MCKVLVSIIIFFISLSSNATDGKLVACIDDHPPYQYLGDTPYGSHISALKVLAKILNKRLTYIQSPNFARCVALLKSGYVDVIAGLNVTEEREKFAFFVPFKAADKLTVITKHGQSINDYSDFKGKVIGVPRGSTYFPKFDNDNTLNKVSIQSDRVGLALLAKERIDLMMVNPEMLNLHFDNIERSELKTSPIVLDEYIAKETKFGFSKKNGLKLTEKKITQAIATAFERGDFRRFVTNDNSLEAPKTIN